MEEVRPHISCLGKFESFRIRRVQSSREVLGQVHDPVWGDSLPKIPSPKDFVFRSNHTLNPHTTSVRGAGSRAQGPRMSGLGEMARGPLVHTCTLMDKLNLRAGTGFSQ